MLDILKPTQNGNGHGHGNGRDSDTIGGRGLARRKLTLAEKISLGADLATGVRSYQPSLKELSEKLGVSIYHLREELKYRADVQDEIDQAAERYLAQVEAEAINAEADAIIDTWIEGSPLAHEIAVRKIGVGNVWDVLARVVA
jgi:hypothetical protein